MANHNRTNYPLSQIVKRNTLATFSGHQGKTITIYEHPNDKNRLISVVRLHGHDTQISDELRSDWIDGLGN